MTTITMIDQNGEKFNYQLLNLARGCCRHVLTNNKDNKDKSSFMNELSCWFPVILSKFETKDKQISSSKFNKSTAVVP